MNSKKLIYLLVAIVALLLVFAVIGKKKGWVGSSKAEAVAVDTVSVRSITETVTANGKIYPNTEVAISSEVSGEVTELYVEEGDSVYAGQLLIKINPSIYQTNVTRAGAYLDQMKASLSASRANMAQVQAQYNQAKAAYDRNLSLYQQKVISASEFDQITAAYKGAEANLNAAKENISAAQFNVNSAAASLNEANQNLSKTTLFAPISGVVSKLNVEKGERVVGTAQMAGTELMRIADLNHMEARVDVNENDVLRVKIGDTAQVEIDAYLNQKFLGVVSEIAYSSTADFSVTTDQVTNFLVKIKIVPASYAFLVDQSHGHKYPFRPGMSSTVDIQTKTVNDALIIPIQSVTTREPEDEDEKESTKKEKLDEIVFVYAEGKAQQRVVKTGIQDDKNIQITEGLKAGELVISAPFKAINKTLKDDMAVEVKKKDDLFME